MTNPPPPDRLMSDSAEAAKRLARNAVDILPEGMLAEQLTTARPLRVKFGIDPTAPDIHLGHTVVLGKLREFQDAGHTVVLIIGDFTARVGDPSGRSAQRPVLEPQEIDANARTFQDQAFKVLDRERTEVRFNSEWLRMDAEGLMKLMAQTTVARLLEREDFSRRIAAEAPISALELLYPLLQGYDSVAVTADVELGGTDQTFNLLFARDVQSAYGQPPQSILTMPILPGIDGVQRMAKSLGNYVGVTDSPEEMFGRLMRLPDDVMPEYFRLLLGEEVPGSVEPVEAKRTLARRLVERFHDAAAATAAERHFDRLFKEHKPPEQVEEATIAANGDVHMPALLAEHFGHSRSEARRLIGQGGVKIDGEALGGDELDVAPERLDGKVVQVGKRHHKRFRLAS